MLGRNRLRFPPGFVWGAATSSYQIEGAAAVGGKGRSIWDDFCDVSGAISDGSTGATGCRHFDMWRQDVELMKWLGLDAYRFSVSWPRVMPDGTGNVNVAGLDFYDRLVDGLVGAGIEPHVTLHHWDLPSPLMRHGGWLSRRTADAFAHYVAAVADRLGDRVRHWTTLNEPYVMANLGYVTGRHAPGLRLSQAEGFDAAHHLMVAHAMGVAALRRTSPAARVGIALNFTPVTRVGDGAAAVRTAQVTDEIHNRWFLEPLAGLPYPVVACDEAAWGREVVRPGDMEAIAAPLDFLGINYYTRQLVGQSGGLPAPEPTTTMGWEVNPQSFSRLLAWIHDIAGYDHYYITENGAAMPDMSTREGVVQDEDRIAYLTSHIAVVRRAIESGMPIDGYFVWSLMDNFEWALGYEQKFGLVAIEPGTLRRMPKLSAEWYRRFIA